MNGLNSLGQRVLFVRRFRQMTQQEIAKLSGIAQSSLASLEADRNKGSRKLVSLAKSLNISPEWLYSGETNGLSINEILKAGFGLNTYSTDHGVNLHKGLETNKSRNDEEEPFGQAIGVKLLAWTTRSILSPGTAYGMRIGDQKRFGWPDDYSRTAYMIAAGDSARLINIKKGDHLLVEPDATANAGDRVIAIKDSKSILLGKALISNGFTFFVHEDEDGETHACLLDDFTFGGVIKGNLRSLR